MDSATLEVEQPAVKPRLIDRRIFVWDCHGELKKSDPMAVQRRMADKAAELNFDPGAAVADIKLAGVDLTVSTDSEKRGDQLAAYHAYGNLAAICKAGFGLQGIDEAGDEGWTEDELLALLSRFWTWCETVKGKADGSLNWR